MSRGAPRGGARGGRTASLGLTAPPRVESQVWLFHKPLDCVTTHADQLGRPTVYDAFRRVLPPELQRVEWSAVGRLDLDTTGLLLMTNDGGFVHYATHPDHGVTKTYHARVRGVVDDATLAPIRAGFELGAGLGQSAPAEARVLGVDGGTSAVELVLREGKNREVRRLLHAIGHPVLSLARVRVNTLGLDVPLGGARRLSDDELATALGFVFPRAPGPSASARVLAASLARWRRPR